MKVQAKRALSLLLALVLTMGLTANAAQVSSQLDQTAWYLLYDLLQHRGGLCDG